MLRSPVLGVVALAVAVAGVAVPAVADEPAPSPTSSEPGLVVTDDGTGFYVDEWGPPPATPTLAARTMTSQAMATELASYTTADAFTLHSNPGATRTIYLDFDGGSLLSTNSWLLQGLSTLLFPGWSTDGSAAFSDAERTVVLEVWARMAEDFAPFDVDVTTQEPAAGGLFRSSAGDTTYGTRVAFSSGTSIQTALCKSGCGGIAWIGTFDAVLSGGETRSPAWVFPGALGNRAKSMAEAASHEAGHTLGLGHDGTTGGGYYSGTALWGPLMGSPYSAGVTQWSRGDYANASNHEDDLAVAQSNGVTLRADEAGGSVATAVPLASLPGGRGVITSRGDEDWLTVTDCSGTVTVHAAPATVGANLDIGLELRGPTGALITTAATATSRLTSSVTGLDAGFSRSLSGGPFHVVVAGIGSGTTSPTTWPATGYDDYGSLGAYRLTVTGCSAGAPPSGDEPPVTDPPVTDTPTPTPVTRPGAPARPRAAPGPLGGRRTVLASWTRPAVTGGTPITAYRVTAYRIGLTGRVVAQSTPRTLAPSARRVSLWLPRGRWVVRVRARNAVGWGPLSAASAAVVPR
ncbi:MAG TPA: zinc-dependent metalloprotease family protein [Nocardioides sp.]|nr:zinc-dependent metalloprotease family protein [Nocardioides sp.]